MYEVILFAAIATIVCALLYSVLGKSVGQGPESGFDPTEIFGTAKEEPVKALSPAIDDQGVPGLQDIFKGDTGFNPREFIDGAKTAYSMILEAFADADRDMLKNLLTPDVYAVYADAITDREAKNLRQVTDLARLIQAEIVHAERDGKLGYISVKYEAELASALMDAEGNVAQGDPDVLSSVSEVWTFERALASSDPTWRLSEVAPSEGDDLEADPTPDTQS